VCLNGIKGSKAAQKVRMQKSWVKTMLTAFFDAKDIIHHEFVPENQTVNGTFHEKVIKRLVIALGQSFRKMGHGVFCATVHQCILWVFSMSFRRNGIPVLSDPPHSPDLFPADFFYLQN
jgi:hypothetical protein